MFLVTWLQVKDIRIIASDLWHPQLSPRLLLRAAVLLIKGCLRANTDSPHFLDFHVIAP